VTTSNAVAEYDNDLAEEMRYLVLNTLVWMNDDQRKIAVQEVLKNCSYLGLNTLCDGLVDMAYDNSVDVRGRARASLVEIGYPVVHPIIDSLMEDRVVNRQLQLVDVLRQIGARFRPDWHHNYGRHLLLNGQNVYHERVRLAVYQVGKAFAGPHVEGVGPEAEDWLSRQNDSAP
jgi:hypothetical protein